MLKQWLGLATTSVLVLGLMVFQGCSKPDISAPEQELDSSGNPMGSEAMMGEGAKGEGAKGEEAPAEGDGAALSAEDEALVAAQKICPISDEELGSMGTPVKVMAGDKAVFLCCGACKDAFEKDPEAALAKLAGN